MQLYIADRNNISVGAWFTLPLNEEEIKERIPSVDTFCDEYYVFIEEKFFKFNEFLSMEEINRIAFFFTEYESTPIFYEVEKLVDRFFIDILNFISCIDYIKVYDECYSMADVVQHYYLRHNEHLSYYDCVEYGEYLYKTGRFLITNHGVFECIRK